MDLEAFKSSPVGRLVPITIKQRNESVPYHGFVPDPLPDDPSLDSATWKTVVNAAASLAELRTLADERLPDPVLIARVTVRREAVRSTSSSVRRRRGAATGGVRNPVGTGWN